MLNPDDLLKPAYMYIVRTREGTQVNMAITSLMGLQGLIDRAHAVGCVVSLTPLNLTRH